MKLKPKAYSMGTCGYEILYKCAKCAYPFTVANDSWHFCPCCGQEIDWGVIVRANEEWKQKFLKVLDKPEEKQKLLDELDALNIHAEVDTRYEMRQTEATKRAIMKSNISYYLGNGWTKEQLIEKGFFKPEDFDNVAL